MKVTVKSLKQIVYEVEIPSDQSSVLELKQEIEKVHNFDHTSLKLVFNGVVLDNSKTLAELNIKDGSVIVMMTSKVKPVNVPKEEAKKEEKLPVTTNTNTSSNTGTTSNTTTTTNTQAQAKDYSSQVKDLMDMGFPKAESEAAIKASQGDVNIAIEFLYNGIPENLPSNLEGENVSGGQEAGSVSTALKSIASIVKILCQNDPSQLQNILLTLQQTSPELIQLIRENEDEFKTLLQQPVTEEDMAAFQQFNNQVGLSGSGQGSSRSGSGTGSGLGGRQREVIRLSQEDKNSIDILKEYGFSEMDAAQAFFACDKNIDQAANLLWDNKLKENDQAYEIDCK